MLKFVFENKKILIISKPFGMPVQADKSGDVDALSEASQILKKRNEKSTLWLLNRIDRSVGGLVLLARDKTTAAKLTQELNTVSKEYLAIVDGISKEGIFEDYLYKDAILGKAFVTSSAKTNAKKAVLECNIIDSVSTEKGVKTLVRIRLQTGRFHQIRAQLSSRGNSIIGDGKYGNREKLQGIALFANRLEFQLDGQLILAKDLPPLESYPWSLFEKEKYIED